MISGGGGECEAYARNAYHYLLTMLAICLGPAVKVPGLVFCAGQTATGEIKQATVRFISFNSWWKKWFIPIWVVELTPARLRYREPVYRISRKFLNLQDRRLKRWSSTMSILPIWKILPLWTRHTLRSCPSRCHRARASRRFLQATAQLLRLNVSHRLEKSLRMDQQS